MDQESEKLTYSEFLYGTVKILEEQESNNNNSNRLEDVLKCFQNNLANILELKLDKEKATEDEIKKYGIYYLMRILETISFELYKIAKGVPEMAAEYLYQERNQLSDLYSTEKESIEKKLKKKNSLLRRHKNETIKAINLDYDYKGIFAEFVSVVENMAGGVTSHSSELSIESEGKYVKLTDHRDKLNSFLKEKACEDIFFKSVPEEIWSELKLKLSKHKKEAFIHLEKMLSISLEQLIIEAVVLKYFGKIEGIDVESNIICSEKEFDMVIDKIQKVIEIRPDSYNNEELEKIVGQITALMINDDILDGFGSSELKSYYTDRLKTRIETKVYELIDLINKVIKLVWVENPKGKKKSPKNLGQFVLYDDTKSFNGRYIFCTEEYFDKELTFIFTPDYICIDRIVQQSDLDKISKIEKDDLDMFFIYIENETELFADLISEVFTIVELVKILEQLYLQTQKGQYKYFVHQYEKFFKLVFDHLSAKQYDEYEFNNRSFLLIYILGIGYNVLEGLEHAVNIDNSFVENEFIEYIISFVNKNIQKYSNYDVLLSNQVIQDSFPMEIVTKYEKKIVGSRSFKNTNAFLINTSLDIVLADEELLISTTLHSKIMSEGLVQTMNGDISEKEYFQELIEVYNCLLKNYPKSKDIIEFITKSDQQFVSLLLNNSFSSIGQDEFIGFILQNVGKIGYPIVKSVFIDLKQNIQKNLKSKKSLFYVEDWYCVLSIAILRDAKIFYENRDSMYELIGFLSEDFSAKGNSVLSNINSLASKEFWENYIESCLNLEGLDKLSKENHESIINMQKFIKKVFAVFRVTDLKIINLADLRQIIKKYK